MNRFPEEQQELDRIQERRIHTGEIMKSFKKDVLEATSTNEMQDAVYGYFFAEFAYAQVDSMFARIRDKDWLEFSTSWFLEDKEILDAIHEGDWSGAKNTISDLMDMWDETYAKVGLGEGTTSRDPRLRDFIDKKMNLVPDKTEPYSHPNMTHLKDVIEGLSS